MQRTARKKQNEASVKNITSAPAESSLGPTLTALPLGLICGYLIGSVFVGLAALIMYLFFTPDGQTVDRTIPQTVGIIAGIIAFIYLFRKFRRHFTKTNFTF